MDKINSSLEDLSSDEKKLVIFKSFLGLEPERAFFLLKNVIGEVDDAISLYATAMFVRQANICNTNMKMESIFENEYDYNRIIESFLKLSQELDMTSSFELSNLYTYMLWNGYFSKNKNMVYYPIKQLPCINTLSHEIMNGKGVCLNVSAMLTDILNKAGYNSAILLGYGNGVLKGYTPPIDIKLANGGVVIPAKKVKTKMLHKICGNHAFNLVTDENGMYIYDSQNLRIFSLNSKNEGNNGKLTLHIKPFLSYYINDKEENDDALTRLLTSDDFCLPCDRETYKEQWELQLEELKRNSILLNAFHADIRLNIDKINNKMNSAKRLVYK